MNVYHPVDDGIDEAVYAVESQLENYADMVAAERKRGDFFRDALHALHLCPTGDDYPCKGRKGEPCMFIGYDDNPNYAACWDEVERRQR